MPLLGVGKPDWVRVPDETGHGGQYRRLDLRVGKCPAPTQDHWALHSILDGPVWCAECAEAGQFFWHRKPE
jgi:hypothetical protein